MDGEAPRLEHVLGDTWCIVTDYCRIPLYMRDRSSAVMIDSGLKNPDREGILALLEQEGICVSSLLTSHFHPDHIGNHSVIKEKHGCTVYMAPYTAILSQDTSNLQFSGYEKYTMTKVWEKYSRCSPDEIIAQDASSVTASGTPFSILWLPGHAVEQVGFVTPDGVAYLADTLLSDHVMQAVKLPYYTCLRLDLQTKESLRKLQYKRYIVAHNGVYDEIGGLIDRNIDNVYKQLDIVEGRATRWMTLEQLSVAVMVHMDINLNAVTKVIGSKRNIQVLAEYLVETGRLTVRVREGYVEYIAAK